MSDNQCTYCGQEGHKAHQCPRRADEKTVSLHLAARNGAPQRIKGIAAETGMPMPELCAAVERLRDAGLVKWRDYKGTGWSLTKQLNQMNEAKKTKRGHTLWAQIMATLPATTAEIAAKTRISTQGAACVMRELRYAGLASFETTSREGGNHWRRVWKIGGTSTLQQSNYADMGTFVTAWRALEHPCTASEMASSTGMHIRTCQKMVGIFKASGLANITAWVPCGSFGRTPEYQRCAPGTPSVKRPPRATKQAINARFRARQKDSSAFADLQAAWSQRLAA